MEEMISKLTPEEAVLFKKLLSKALTKNEHKSSPIKNTLRPYKLCLVTKCKTCSSIDNVYLDMIVSEDQSGLVSRRTNDTTMTVGDSTEYRYVSYCIKCKEYLSSLDHATLVDMYIKLLTTRPFY